MRIAEMNWMQVEARLAVDDRAVLPIGSTEQHAFLSLTVDATLAERVAAEAAAPLGVPVFPVMPYGLAPYFLSYPGTVSLKVSTLLAVVGDILDSLSGHGFRRILIVNGHGGNNPVDAFVREWVAGRAGHRVRFHNWWNAPRTWAAAMEVDPSGSHGNWMENFPWTRLPHAPAPPGAKPAVDMALMKASPPATVRAMLGDGSFGGPWQMPDEAMLRIWAAGVAETRAALEGPWPGRH